MRRTAKIALGVLAAVAAVLILNAIALSSETKRAAVTTDGAEIVETSIGGLQVLEEGDAGGPPIVLIHCYTCSLHWWDRLAPLLARDHRVIRVDLLGHGGSDKPKAGYGIEQQASGVAEAMAELGVENATVVGHSLGATVAIALAVQSPRLGARVVDIDQAPASSFGQLSFTARLAYAPVIGEAMNRLARIGPASVVEDEYQQAFAPDFSIPSGFENPDQVVDDLRAMTHTAYTDTREAQEDYTEEQPLDERAAAAGIPLLVVFGTEDQIYESVEALAAFEDVPGVRTAMVEGAGHSPNVEVPERVAGLIREFATDPGDEAGSERPPANVGRGGERASKRTKQPQRARGRSDREGPGQGEGTRRHGSREG